MTQTAIILSGGQIYRPSIEIQWPPKDQAQFTPEILGNMLGKICAYNGATTSFYSLAQRSCLLANAIFEETQSGIMAFHGLLSHISDINVTKTKSQDRKDIEYDIAKSLQISEILSKTNNIENIIEKLGKAQLAVCRLIATEITDLFPRRFTDEEIKELFGELLPPRLPRRIIPYAWDIAARKFVEDFEIYKALAEIEDCTGASPPLSKRPGAITPGDT